MEPKMVNQHQRKTKAHDLNKTARQIRQEAAEARLAAAKLEDQDTEQITLSALAYVYCNFKSNIYLFFVQKSPCHAS